MTDKANTISAIDTASLEPGKIYLIAGQGPMKLLRLFTAHSRQYRNLSGYDYWASDAQLVRECTAADVDSHIAALIERDIVPAGFKPEW